jgi:hypothetical protein
LLAAGSLVGTLVTLAPACGLVSTGIRPAECLQEDGGNTCEDLEVTSHPDPDAGSRADGGDAGTERGDAG